VCDQGLATTRCSQRVHSGLTMCSSLTLQALHQMTAADNSGDGKLTLSEMVSNPYVFYGSSGAHNTSCFLSAEAVEVALPSY
jgi:hypothetical protein